MVETGETVSRQRRYFAQGHTREIAGRIVSLRRLQSAVEEHEKEIEDALFQDLGKSAFEAYETEIGMVLEEIGFAIRHLHGWARPQRVHTPLMHFPSVSRVYSEPYGVALILSPWNYPFQLTMAPLAAALAAGNCAVVKPSAYSPATSAVIARILTTCFPPDYVAVVEGGRAENQALLSQNFDYIFFTGGVTVGKLVMESASRSLTPVTLELGGKSPVIVTEDADAELAARRIIWGKTLNAGQTCVAPDYVLVHRRVMEPLVAAMQRCITQFFGAQPLKNPDYPRIVNEKHFQRLTGYLSCGRLLAGGETDAGSLRIAPTLLGEPPSDSPVMQEEIFGPLLPVLPFDDLEEAIAFVNARPRPLALYLFTMSIPARDKVLSRVRFGGGCVNDTIVHLATSHMPFGGVGESGMGGYHGKFGFDTFSHKKSVLQKSVLLDIRLRYPPYDGKMNLLRRFLH